MSLEGPPGSFQPEDDDSYRESTPRSPTPVRHLKSHLKTVAGSRLASRLDAPEYKEAQLLQKDSSPLPRPPKPMNVQRAVKYITQSFAYLINKQEKQNIQINKRFNEVLKAIVTIPSIADPRARSARPRLDMSQINIDDSLQIIPRSLQMTSKTYSYNEQIKEAINQRVTRSPNYNRCPDKHPRCKRFDERLLKFSKGSYLDDRRNFQYSFDINNYFFQTAEYDRFKIKRQDIGVFDPQFPNLKGQGAVTDNSRLVFTDVYNFIKCIYILLEDSSTAHETKQQIKAIFSTLFVEIAVIQQTTELINDVRNILYSDGLVAIMCVLRQRFTPD